jgi:hypothetical protein
MGDDPGGVRATRPRARGQGRRIRHNRLIVRLLPLAVALVAATVLVASASASLFFLFSPTDAAPNDRVTVRLGGTPASFKAANRRLPFQRPIRLYLVPNDVAASVRTRFDPRLHFIGALVPDRDARGILTFTVPPLATDDYAVAAWCLGCAPSSAGRTFFVLPVGPNDPGRFVDRQLLDVRMPDPASSCPVTKGRHGNGFLSVTLPADGILRMQREADGTLFDKLGWVPKRNWTGNLTVRGERLDGPGSVRVLNVVWGHTVVNGKRGLGSWMTPVVVPAEGCYRFTGRVGDIALSYVVKVVASP